MATSTTTQYSTFQSHAAALRMASRISQRSFGYGEISPEFYPRVGSEAYQSGLKTGVYYLRRKPKHQAQQFTIEPDKKEDKKETEYEICEMCSA